MEKLINQMQDEKAGVPIRTVKSFMSKIPSVFTGEIILNITLHFDMAVLSSVGKNADLGRCWFKKINLRFKREFREWPDVFTVFYSTTHQLQHNLCEWC